ncbi:MAG: type II toxin-antitoxin system HicB family antitoxin [Massilia sp.]
MTVGCVVGVVDSITFHGATVTELLSDFHAAIDGYLLDCEEQGREPDPPPADKLVLDIPPELHAFAAIAAQASGKSINDWAVEALTRSAQAETSLRPSSDEETPATSS